MYAEDFAGKAGTTADVYERGSCVSSPQHPGLASESISGYEVVYNTYDWGLNDSVREPHLGPILFHEPVEHFAPADRELRELHLYEGNFCNRKCEWCTIRARRRLVSAVLRRGARSGGAIAGGGRQSEVLRRRTDPSRQRSHRSDPLPPRARISPGLVTIFSNGVKAGALIAILESDSRTRGGTQLLDLPRPRRRTAARTRQTQARSLEQARIPVESSRAIRFCSTPAAERSWITIAIARPSSTEWAKDASVVSRF